MNVFKKFGKQQKREKEKRAQDLRENEREIARLNQALAKMALEIYPHREELSSHFWEPTRDQMAKELNRRMNFCGFFARKKWWWGLLTAFMLSFFFGTLIDTLAGRRIEVAMILRGNWVLESALIVGLDFVIIELLDGFAERMKTQYYECEAAHYLLRYLRPADYKQSFEMEFREVPMRHVLDAFFEKRNDEACAQVRSVAHTLTMEAASRKSWRVVDAEPYLATESLWEKANWQAQAKEALN